MTNIRLGLDNLKLFTLLFNDKSKDSDMKLTSFVVTDKEHDLVSICSDCIKNVLPLKMFKDTDTCNN